MECLGPITVKKSPGDPKQFIRVPCGKCASCLERKRSQWTFRLLQELKVSFSAWFVTLTYNDENEPGYISKVDVQLFIKRLRKWISDHSADPKKLRYFIVGEYGKNTFRCHYHGILFNTPEEINLATEKNYNKILEDLWGKGFVHVGDVTGRSIGYTCKYIINEKVKWIGDKKLQLSFNLMSRKPGIGVCYVEKMGSYHNENKIHYAVGDNGKKTALPRYYRDKIFNKADIIAENFRRQFDQDKAKNEFEKKCLDKGESPGQNEIEGKTQYKESKKLRSDKNNRL